LWGEKILCRGDRFQNSKKKSPGAKIRFENPGKKFYVAAIDFKIRRRNPPEQKFDLKIRGKNFMSRRSISKFEEEIPWSENLILKTGEKILCRGDRFQNSQQESSATPPILGGVSMK
jgi:hypothetical protein